MAREIEDRNVASRVRMLLGTDPETAPYPSIRVECENGVVTLEGSVDREAVRRRAVELAGIYHTAMRAGRARATSYCEARSCLARSAVSSAFFADSCAASAAMRSCSTAWMARK